MGQEELRQGDNDAQENYNEPNHRREEMDEESMARQESVTMMEEEGMENMQKSFGSFFAAAMGGGGKVYLPDGTEIDAPKIKMPSLAELMNDSSDPEEKKLARRVRRGELFAGVGLLTEVA